ncbi:piggyBac transposable element-derived protein 3-like, partial [Armigeres subalbatus]|uniref:piggyBac transposable element-derived protein 3-like n=1 Tax=Armigeres subalbatus TaxID=124917 RepID=UPI002ED3F4B9
MDCRRKGKLCILSDRQAKELLESLDIDLDTDEEEDPGDDFESDDYNDPEIEELFSSPPAPKRRKLDTSGTVNTEKASGKSDPLMGPGTFVGSADSIDPKSAAFKNIKWKKANLGVPESDLLFEEADLEQFKDLDTPFKCFSYFLDGILEHIAAQTNLYAKQKNITSSFSTTALEIRKFFGALLYMSVFRYPSIRSYWSEYAFHPIQNTLPRNRFDAIRRFIHFNDNDAIPAKNSAEYDRLYKIRPIVNYFNERFETVPLPQHVCVDEQMCATKMKSTLRQYLANKPHKWGFKLFVLSDSFGYSYRFEVYCGAGDNVVLPGTPDLGATANVVVRLSKVLPDFRNHIMYFDNFYTSLPLLTYLRSRGIFALGTIRNNRIPNNKLPTDTALKKCERGYSTEYVGTAHGVSISTTVWNDNKAVRLASSYVGVKSRTTKDKDPTDTVSRFVRSTKRRIDVACPPMIREYNRHMGGVDMADGLIGRYRIRVKTTKYTNRLVYHLLDLAMVDSYVLFKRVHKIDPSSEVYQLPNFRAEVAKAMCTYKAPAAPRPPGRPRIISTKKPSIPKRAYLPLSDTRYDGTEHFPEILPRSEKRTCKNPGCKSETSTYACKR